MEITELATHTLDTLQPFLEAGGKELVKGITSDLWSKVKSVFNGKEEKKVLEEFEQNPTDLKIKGKVEYILEKELQNNPELTKGLFELVELVRKSDDYSTIVNQIGNDNISIGGKISKSKINIRK
jgi:hypothetical protein